MKVTIKLIMVALLCTTIGSGLLFAAGAREANVSRLSIAGGPAGGAYYAVSLGMADLLMNKIQGMTIDVVTTGGNIENALFVGQRENDFGLSTGDAVKASYDGTDAFAGRKQGDLRVMFSGVAGGAFHLITHTRITSIEQLRGRRIAMGPEGNVSPPIGFIVFRHHGLNPGDFTPSYLSFPDGMSALSDGQVEASLATGAIPLGAVQELAANLNFNYRIHSINRSVLDGILKENPVYGSTIIPSTTYNRQGEDVLTVGTTNYMLVNVKVPDDVVYQLVKITFENLETLHRSHPSARAISLEGATDALIPIHNGAIRYYKERGLIK